MNGGFCHDCRGHANGFSMLELMLVTAIMALLTTLAVPAYQSLTVRSYRTEAIAVLMRTATCQERLRITFGKYDAGRCQPTQTSRYRYATVSDSAGGPGFLITAIPIGRQAADHCGAMSLDHNGLRQVENVQADAGRCWSGR